MARRERIDADTGTLRGLKRRNHDGEIEPDRQDVVKRITYDLDTGAKIDEESWEGRARLCSKTVFPLIVRSGQISDKGERTKFLLRASGCGIVRLGSSTF